ncbi:PREDICTED: uncharacterized protein LOC108361172 [Rhagoletis zephyria]|uniref:uncharacterized protein LOC108361172 n=1 Tax=Rhagoletis zephyria TaxID=28612 RepID=UPI00081154E3|nr:PREDICTED: uncharacterized protein LOC108361172 [Rhagoletis zephyria]
MEKHPETGRGKPQFGSSKSKSKGLWEQFAIELNSLAPPTRTAHEWGRVWIHYKANLKRKLANNRSNILATGGGPSQEVSLNPLEESVAELIQIREQVAVSGRAFGVENIPPVMDGEEIEDGLVAASSMVDLPQVANIEDRPSSSASRVQNRRRSCNLETERLELLKMQAETQKEVLKKIDRIEKTAYKNYDINKKLLHIKQQKYKLFERQAREAHELHLLKVEVEQLKIAKLRGYLQDKNSS